MKRLMLAALAAVFAAGAFGLTDAERARLQASLRAPRLYPGITWEQLQRLHEEQLSKMYVVRDGKEGKDWIQIRDWSAVTCELKALPASQEIPKAYEVEIHRVEPTGDWFARVARKGKPNVGLMVKVVPPKGMAGEVGDVKMLWLVRRRVPIDDAGAVSSTVVWAVIPEETAATYRVPTAREVALAMRDEGKTFVVKLPTATGPCPRCDGRGTLARPEPRRSASARQEAGDGRDDFLTRPSTPYLRAQQGAQRGGRAETIRCPECDGRGAAYEEAFRTIFFKKS